MIRSASAFRAFAFTTAVVLAGATLASAAETTATTTVETKTEVKFMPTIYVGPGFGYANTDQSDDFGWSIWALMRPYKYAALQIEYFNVGDLPKPASGNFDGGYFGIMPILP